MEKNVTYTAPHDADTNNDRIKYGNEHFDSDGLDNTHELKLPSPYRPRHRSSYPHRHPVAARA